MRNRIYISYIATFLLSFIALSCVKEEVAVPGDPDNVDCYGVYFPSQSGAADVQIDPDHPTQFVFKVSRLKSDDAITVPVKIISDHAEIFTHSELVFEEDETTSELTVFFPSAKMGKTYECTLLIDDPLYSSAYSSVSNHLRFSVTRVKWNRLTGPNGETTGTYRDGVFRDWFAVPNPDVEKQVTIEERDDMPGFYRIFDVYDEQFLGNMFGSNVSNLCIAQTYTYINATNPDKVWIPTFKAGVLMMAEYGEVSIGSYVSENEDFDPSISSVYGKLEDGVITFPSGALQMKMENYGWYNANASGTHRIIFPGCRAKDYDLSLSAGVSDENGVLPVSVDFGQDIVQVKLAVFEGELTSSAAAEKGALMAEEDPSIQNMTTLDTRSSMYYSFDKTGMYTVVAAAFDIKGDMYTTDFVTFGYLAKGDEGRKVKLDLGLISSDKYASEGLTAKNALEIYISGKHIERLHVGLYEMQEWQRDSVGIMDEILESQMSASYLAQVNGEGLSLKQGYLIPGTEYVLVAQAYNGYREERFVVAEWTKGKWDPRLATYDLADVNPDLSQSSAEAYTGRYHNYAIASGMYSREYLGDAVIELSDQRTSTSDTGSAYPCVTISGLFPRCMKNFGLPDDSVDFFFYQGFLFNYKQRFGSYYWEGLYIYPEMLLISTDGGAYGAYAGIMGGFVRDGYLAFVDSGEYASYGLEFEGFATLAFSDENQNSFIGLIDLTTDILLVREDLDPDPIISDVDDSDEWDEEVSMEQLKAMEKIIRKGPSNLVETFEGFLMSAADRIRMAVPDNKLDLETEPVDNEVSFEFKEPPFGMNVGSEIR